MSTRILALWLCFWGFAVPAWALDRVTLKAGYNLRESAGGTVLRTNRRTQSVTVLEDPKGKWVKVCLGSGDGDCKGGQARWVFRGALVPSADAADPKAPAKIKESDATAARTDATCEGCKPPKNGMNRKVDPILNAIENSNIPGYPLDRNYHARCAGFISKKGVGPWGAHVIKAAHKVAPNCFYGRNLFGSLCPNYLDLDQPQKEAMVALAFAAIGQRESTCKPTTRVRGTNDIADGIFALEYSADQRSDAGRSKTWCKSKETVDTQAWEFQSECAASIINDRICKVGAYIFGPRSYWEEFKSGDGDIAQMIYTTSRKWGLCKD